MHSLILLSGPARLRRRPNWFHASLLQVSTVHTRSTCWSYRLLFVDMMTQPTKHQRTHAKLLGDILLQSPDAPFKYDADLRTLSHCSTPRNVVVCGFVGKRYMSPMVLVRVRRARGSKLGLPGPGLSRRIISHVYILNVADGRGANSRTPQCVWTAARSSCWAVTTNAISQTAPKYAPSQSVQGAASMM